MRTALEWMLEKTSARLLLASEDGRIFRASGRVEQAFGYARASLAGARLDTLVSERCREALGGRLRDLFAAPAGSAHASIDPVVAVRSDGSEFQTALDLDVVPHEGRCLIACEFLEREAAPSLEQFAMADHFRLALEAAPTGMMVVDESGKIRLVNAQIERIFGHDRCSLMGRSLEDLVPTAARSEHQWHRQAFFREPTARPMGAGRELHGLHRDGRHVPVEIALTPLESPGGRLVLTSVIDVTERQLAERALRHSEARHRELFSNSPVALLEQDLSEVRAYIDHLQLSSGKSLPDVLRERPGAVLTAMEKVGTLMANQQALTLFEISSVSELNPWSDLLTSEAFDWFRRALCDLHEGHCHFGAETRVRTRRGNIKVVNKRIHLLSGHQGTWSRMVVSLFDLTAHQRAEDSLRASLREKEVLLREIHHRVKNNLQIVSSLLSLKSDAFDDEALRQVLADCQARVRSLAILHEHLYSAQDLSNVSFSSYIRTLLEHLRRSSGSPRQSISFAGEVTDIGVAIDDAIPCGLIINELVTNALKHAFPGTRAGHIVVGLRAREGGELEVIVSDDGIGLPPAAEPGPASLGSSGLDLVFTFAEQLRARVEIERDHGTRFSIRFRPTPWAGKRS